MWEQSRPACFEPVADLLVVETETAMGLRVAEELVAVRREVDDEEATAGGDQSCRLGDRPRRIVEVVQHLVDHDEVERRRRRPAGCRRRPGGVRSAATPLRSRLARATESIEWLESIPTARVARGPSSWRMRPVPVPRSTIRPTEPVPTASTMAASTASSAACSERSSSQIGAIRSKYSCAVVARRARTLASRSRSAVITGSVGSSDARAPSRIDRPGRRPRAGRTPRCPRGASRPRRRRRAA